MKTRTMPGPDPGSCNERDMDETNVSVYRAPHLPRSRALEVRTVRLHARRLAATAPCKRLLDEDIADMGHPHPGERLQTNGRGHINCRSRLSRKSPASKEIDEILRSRFGSGPSPR